MAFKLKKRGVNDLKKVLIYGEDGSGKSTFAETYCREHKLNPIVIDIDDTNYSNLDILDLDFGSDLKTYNNLKTALQEITKSSYDTIIIDGVTSLLEMLVSKSNGLKKYSDRAERFQDLLRLMRNSGKHLIFIGQIDMKVIHNEEFQSNKMIVKVNSIVNEKYLTIHEKGVYSHKVIKYRGIDIDEETAEEIPNFTTADSVDEPSNEDPVIMNYAKSITKKLVSEGLAITKRNMKKKTFELVKSGDIPSEFKEKIYEFIDENCPKT